MKTFDIDSHKLCLDAGLLNWDDEINHTEVKDVLLNMRDVIAKQLSLNVSDVQVTYNGYVITTKVAFNGGVKCSSIPDVIVDGAVNYEKLLQAVSAYNTFLFFELY